MVKRPQLLIMTGPMTGRRFSIPEGGLRLGRSSSNDVHVPDEELSRNHCLFEPEGEAGIHVIDLASANGTYVNSVQLGGEAKSLKLGDIVEVGATVLKVVDEDSPDPVLSPLFAHGKDAPEADAKTAPGGDAKKVVDLGLGDAKTADASAAAKPKSGRARLANVLWGVVALSIATLIAVILLFPAGEQPPVKPVPADELKQDGILGLYYEKIEADASRIFRYTMTMDGTGVLRVLYDDVPGENRHVDKSARLSGAALKRIAEIFRQKGWDELDAAYTGPAAEDENALKRFRVRAVAANGVRDVLVENAPEPEAFQTVREALETFSRNELGVWALQYSSDKLVELAAESERVGDMKWRERDVETGNLASAIAAYKEAVFYLETVNPKPLSYAALREKLSAALDEQDRRYRDQRFLADKAINLKDWETAKTELRTLLDLVPDKNDDRHAEASGKLVDVERRIEEDSRKGKGRKGGGK